MLWNATTGRDHWEVFQSYPNTGFIRLEGKSWCQGQSKTESDQARRNAKGEQRTRTETGSRSLDVEVQCEFRKQELKREGSPRSRRQQIQGLVRGHFLVRRQLSSGCVLTWWKGARELSGVSFIRALIPSMRAPPSRPNHLPKAPPPNTTTLGTRFQHLNLGEHKHLVYSKD